MDFDEARKQRDSQERQFVIGGETFTRRAAVRPEYVLAWNKAITGETEYNEEQWIAFLDETIVSLLDPGQEEKWLAVRASEEDVITSSDMLELVKWMLRKATGRPTGPSTDSSDGRERTGTTSTDGSSSPDLRAVSQG